MSVLIRLCTSVLLLFCSFLTALHLATDKSNYDVMELLLEKGAKVNALDNLGQTALHRAAQQGNVQACKLLMAYNIGVYNGGGGIHPSQLG